MDLEKATMVTKDTRSAMRAKKEELHQAGDIAAGKPFMLRRKFGDPQYAPLDRLWSSADGLSSAFQGRFLVIRTSR